MRKVKQPTRQQLAEHIDFLVDALASIPTSEAAEAIAAHNKWVRRVF